MKREAMIAHLVLHGWKPWRYRDGVMHLWNELRQDGITAAGVQYLWYPDDRILVEWRDIPDSLVKQWFHRVGTLK